MPVIFGHLPVAALNGEVNLTTQAVRATLVDASYTVDQDGHSHLSDVTEIVDPNYHSVQVSTVAVAYDPATNLTTITGDDPIFPGTNASPKGVVFYVDGGSAATSPLIAHHYFTPESQGGAALVFRLVNRIIAQFQVK